MAFQVGLFFLVGLLATGAAMAAYPTDQAVYFGLGRADVGHGLSGDPFQEMMMESDSARRQLAQGSHIGYGAMGGNRIPCNQRGQSYYNCRGHQRANPYTRGCTRITNCARSNR